MYGVRHTSRDLRVEFGVPVLRDFVQGPDLQICENTLSG